MPPSLPPVRSKASASVLNISGGGKGTQEGGLKAVCNQGNDQPNAQASTLSPCFSTTASNLSAMPLGRFVPASHFWTVDSLVFR